MNRLGSTPASWGRLPSLKSHYLTPSWGRLPSYMNIREVGYPMAMLIYKDSMGSILMGVPYPMNGHAVVG